MPKECLYIFKKGHRKGAKCNKTTEDNSSFCILHINQNKNSKKPEVIDFIDIEQKEEENLKKNIIELPTNFQNKSVLLKHYDNIKRLESGSTEYYKNLMFINSGLNIPWDKYYNISQITDDIEISEFIRLIQIELDKRIYGMQNVKNEILNYICKMITNPKSTRNNIALHGPAGVAKSKFVEVISDILGIPVKTISLGGIKDSSFFLGHGYVYVESGPGKIIQNIIDSKIMNPILYFDELDKVSEAESGKDIYSFLTYLTDSTQNSKFSEHYFYGMTFDLSKVFYIFTFNDINKIDKVLLDRLNVIYVETPSNEEKIHILENYCLDEILKNIGISKSIVFSKECYEYIIEFTNNGIDSQISSGVRESYRVLEKIILQINKDILLKRWKEKDKRINIDIKMFLEYFKLLRTQFVVHKEDSSPPPFMYI